MRTVRLPGVADKDVASAIELQLDTLHPWDEEAIEWSWWRVSLSELVVGIARQSTLSRYETLFSEAGIPMAGATFSSAVIHAALRLQHAAPKSVFCYMLPGNGRIEVYGESEARPCYSAEYALSTERALAVARAELRLPPEYVAAELGEALTAPPSISPLAFAAALAASAPLSVRFANLLPAARRASHSRTQYVIPIALAALVAIGLVTVFVLFPVITERRYVRDLTAEQNRLAPIALRVQSIDKTLAAHRARIAALDDFRRRPQADLDVLNELVRILPEKVWTDSIEIFPDSIVIGGEADQAEPLLKLLESSPLFQKSRVCHVGNAQRRRGRVPDQGHAPRARGKEHTVSLSSRDRRAADGASWSCCDLGAFPVRDLPDSAVLPLLRARRRFAELRATAAAPRAAAPNCRGPAGARSSPQTNRCRFGGSGTWHYSGRHMLPKLRLNWFYRRAG